MHRMPHAPDRADDKRQLCCRPHIPIYLSGQNRTGGNSEPVHLMPCRKDECLGDRSSPPMGKCFAMASQLSCWAASEPALSEWDPHFLNTCIISYVCRCLLLRCHLQCSTILTEGLAGRPVAYSDQEVFWIIWRLTQGTCWFTKEAGRVYRRRQGCAASPQRRWQASQQ